MSSADNLFKLSSDPDQAKLFFSILIVFLKAFFKKYDFESLDNKKLPSMQRVQTALITYMYLKSTCILKSCTLPIKIKGLKSITILSSKNYMLLSPFKGLNSWRFMGPKVRLTR